MNNSSIQTNNFSEDQSDEKKPRGKLRMVSVNLNPRLIITKENIKR